MIFRGGGGGGGGGVGPPVPPSGYAHVDPKLTALNSLLEAVADPVCEGVA